MLYYVTLCYVTLQEGTEDGTVMVLVGNKTDLAEDDDNRVVKTKDGVKLADVSRTYRKLTYINNTYDQIGTN